MPDDNQIRRPKLKQSLLYSRIRQFIRHNLAMGEPKDMSPDSLSEHVELSALLDALNRLAPQQLDVLLLKLAVPRYILPGKNAPHGDRVTALIEWAQSTDGPGLGAVAKMLREIPNPPWPLRAAITTAVLLLSVAGLGSAGLHLWEWYNRKMPLGNAFSVAIVDFMKVDKNQRLQSTDKGKSLSIQVSNLLNKEKTGDNHSFDTANWFISKPNKYHVDADSFAEFQEKIGSFARDIDADLLIYGIFTDGQDPEEQIITLYFYLSPTLHSKFIDTFDFKGQYQLGTSAIINVDDKGGTESFLSARAKSLFWLAAGLNYSSDIKKSKEILENVSRYLVEDEQIGYGAEIFYFCVGQVALFSANSDARPLSHRDREKYLKEAENAFQKALSFNNQYPRALIGMGSVYLIRASLDREQLNGTDPKKRFALQQQIDRESRDALTKYEEVIKLLPETGPDVWSESGARLGIATYWLDKGNYDLDNQRIAEAEPIPEKVEEMIQAILVPLEKAKEYRPLSQAYANLGAAYVLEAEIRRKQGNSEFVQQKVNMAIEAFNSCKKQVEKNPEDNIIGAGIVKKCNEYINYAKEL